MPETKDKKADWQRIGISNDFLFGKIMQDPELCRELLNRILPDLPIDRVEYPVLQKPIDEDADARSVRLDVYVVGAQTVYDIEMQAVDTKELPKRSRYYQSMIDLQLIDKGQSYNKLNDSYVIFICLTDLFRQGRHRYTFENRCREDSRISLGDGATRIFLNAAGSLNDVSEDLRTFLDYAAGGEPKDTFVKKLDDAVRKAKRNREWRHEFMTLLMREQENLEKGFEQGIEQGMERGKIYGAIAICRDLNMSGEMIVKKLMEKFHLTAEEAREYLNN